MGMGKSVKAGEAPHRGNPCRWESFGKLGSFSHFLFKNSLFCTITDGWRDICTLAGRVSVLKGSFSSFSACFIFSNSCLFFSFACDALLEPLNRKGGGEGSEEGRSLGSSSPSLAKRDVAFWLDTPEGPKTTLGSSIRFHIVVKFSGSRLAIGYTIRSIVPLFFMGAVIFPPSILRIENLPGAFLASSSAAISSVFRIRRPSSLEAD
mmetsp:Transcript_24163/g.47504  ORF Transcript_24163/g.47504 Transcript_24163/m.47504 type:complete len:207 (+) Transcript_24163:1300-1920(+)